MGESGVDPGFFKVRGEGGGTLGWQQSMGHAHKMLLFENWNLIEYCYTRKILAIP